MLIAVCSLKGSPGVTTFAVALAACRWPAGSRSVLVEADPAGGDLMARFQLHLTPGLISLAAAARGNSYAGLLWRHTQLAPGGVPVVPCPPGAEQARSALTALLYTETDTVDQAAAEPDAIAIVDAGRVDATSPVLPLLRRADQLLVLSRARADDLAHVSARLGEVARWSPRVGLLLVGSGYSAAEVSAELDIPVMATLPDDRRSAALLRGLSGPRRGLTRSGLGQAAADVATTVMRARHRRTPGHTIGQTLGQSIGGGWLAWAEDTAIPHPDTPNPVTPDGDVGYPKGA